MRSLPGPRMRRLGRSTTSGRGQSGRNGQRLACVLLRPGRPRDAQGQGKAGSAAGCDPWRTRSRARSFGAGPCRKGKGKRGDRPRPLPGPRRSPRRRRPEGRRRFSAQGLRASCFRRCRASAVQAVAAAFAGLFLNVRPLGPRSTVTASPSETSPASISFARGF